MNPSDPAAFPLLLDGPVGTELARRGLATPLPLWSARAIEETPELLAAIHGDYAAAGATVHTANTFRTQPFGLAALGRADADRLTHAAVRIARGAVPRTHRIAGSMAPLRDCYAPQLSPPPAVAGPAHQAMADLLAAAGVDLLLCETFPHPGEALLAAAAAVRTGLPTWLSLTPGPEGDLLQDHSVVQTARRARDLGVERVLVNCGRPDRLLRGVEALAAAQIPTGAYGNVGAPCPTQGWRADGEDAPAPYGEWAARWVAAGAGVVGGCCGTTPAHIAAVAARLRAGSAR